jgi:hypothetical protein
MEDFENMNLDQLNDNLVRLLKHKAQLEQAKKDYVASIKEQVNETKARIEAVVECIDMKRAEV